MQNGYLIIYPKFVNWLKINFSLPLMGVNSFEGLKKDIAESSVKVIDDELLFVIETDALEKVIRGTITSWKTCSVLFLVVKPF